MEQNTKKIGEELLIIIIIYRQHFKFDRVFYSILFGYTLDSYISNKILKFNSYSSILYSYILELFQMSVKVGTMEARTNCAKAKLQ